MLETRHIKSSIFSTNLQKKPVQFLKYAIQFNRSIFKGSQGGSALLSTMILIIFLGILALSMTTLLVADSQMQVLNMQKRQAYYAAQSGIDYTIRGISEYAVSSGNISALHGYTETLNTGNGSTCDITINSHGSDSLTLRVTGHSGSGSSTLLKGLKYIDVASYKVYAAGTVSRIYSTRDIMQNAAYMPVFDNEVLRNAARPTRYYSGNLNVSWAYNFPSSTNMPVVFTDGNLTINPFLWSNTGAFVSMGNTTLVPWHFITIIRGIFYLPGAGSNFVCNKPGLSLGVFMNGGILSNGNVRAFAPYFFGIFRFRLTHSRAKMANFLEYSVNGGPLIFYRSRFSIYN